MLLLVDEVKKRTQFLNTYIQNLSQSINKRRYNQTLSFINQQRPAINHTNVTKYNPNTFVIDSLKQKNQSLTQIKKQLQKEKLLLQKKLHQHNINSSGVKQKVHDQNIMIVVSKIEITFKDIKRVQYQHMKIDSDYEKLIITTLQQEQIKLLLTGIFQLEKKSLNMLFHYQQQKQKHLLKLWVVMKFHDELQLSKWQNLILYGQMLQQAKSKRYLFLGGENYRFSQREHGHVERKGTLNDQSQVAPYLGHIPTQGMGFRGTFIPQKQQNIQKPHNIQSIVHQRQTQLFTDANTQHFNISQQQFQKQMTNSLLISPNENMLITKKPINNYSSFRPTPLNRIRGKSLYLQIERGRNYQQYKRQPNYNNYYEQQKGEFFDNRSQKQPKSSHKNNFRKASQDITLRIKNPNSQERKLQKFRSQRNLIDELFVQSSHLKHPKKPHSIDRNYHSVLVANHNIGTGSISGNSRRIQKQIKKKNQFLQRVNMNFQNNNNKGNNNDNNENLYNSKIFSNSNKKPQNNQQHYNNRKQLQTTARWFTQEDLKSQSLESRKSSKKSQFSHNNTNSMSKKILYNRQNKQLFEEQIEYSLEDQSVENNSQHKNNRNFIQNHRQQDQIIEASQSHQISPTFPKKIVYEDGSHIRLYPVEFTHNNEKNNDNHQHHQLSTKNNNNKHTNNNEQDKQQKDNVFIQPLQEMEQNQLEQSRHDIRNDRLNTLDSETDKEEHNHTNQMNESNSEDHQQQQFQQLIDQLKKGLILTKCAQGSFWTREKQIKLSQNQNTLLIIDVKDKKIKKLPISDIQTVQYGKFSKGIIKHIPQIQQKKCLIINVKQGKTIKKIQFVGNNPQKLALFTQNLAYFVEMFKAS